MKLGCAWGGVRRAIGWIGNHQARQVRRRAAGLAWAGLLLAAPAWAADPQITAIDDTPDPVAAGGLYRYTVGVDNSAVDDAANAVLSFTVPAGAEFVSASPASANCAATSATTVRCALGTVRALGAAPHSVVLTWRALVAGIPTVNASASLTATQDDNLANNSQAEVTTVEAGADLVLTQTAAPDPVTGGGGVSYTLSVRNAGPNAGAAMQLTSLLQDSVAYESFSQSSGSAWSCSASGQTVSCSYSGSLAVGATAPDLVIRGRVSATSGTLTHSASVAPVASTAGGVSDPDLDNNSGTVNVQAQPGADARIAALTVLSSQPAAAGQTVRWRVQPRNSGPAALSAARVTQTLPAGWVFISASGSGWSCSASGQLISCTRSSLSSSASDDITLEATAPLSVAASGNAYTLQADIDSATADPDSSNNRAQAEVTVLRDGADLAIAVSRSPNPVALGAQIDSTVTVRNVGPRSASGVLRVVLWLQGETWVSAGGSGWSCTAAGAELRCDHANTATLAVGASLPDLTLTTTADLAGTVRAQACTGGSLPTGATGPASPPTEGDPNSANDCSSSGDDSVTATTLRPDLAVTLSASTPGGDTLLTTAESEITYTLVARNLGSDAASGTLVELTLPSTLFVSGRTVIGTLGQSVSAGSAVFSCSASGALIRCTQSGGSLAAGQSLTVTVPVRRPLFDGVNLTATATVDNRAEGDPQRGNNSADASVTVQPVADVQMQAVRVTPASVHAGETLTYVLTVRNDGPSSAQAVTLADSFTLPGGDAGITVLSVSPSVGSCSLSAGAQISSASPGYSCSLGALSNQQEETVTLVLRPNFQTGDPARTLGSSASVSTTTVESDSGNNSATGSLSVTASSADLLVNLTDSLVGTWRDPVPYYDGSGGLRTFIDYRVQLTNRGPSYATGVHFTQLMTPPASGSGKRIRFVCDTAAFGTDSSSSASASCNASSLCSATGITSAAGSALASFSCQVPAGDSSTGSAQGDLASGQSKNVFLRFEVLDTPEPTGDVYVGSTTVSGNEADAVAGNNTLEERTTTRQRIDLRVSKCATVGVSACTANGLAATLNQPFSWTVTVSNGGPGTALATNVTDTLPAGAQLTGAVSASQGSCSVSGSTVSCALGSLGSGASATITLPVRFTSLPSGGSASNSATVDDRPADDAGNPITGAINLPGGFTTATSSVQIVGSTLSGTVFDDRSRSGSDGGTPQAASAEPRLAGVSLRLTGSDRYGNPIDLSATSAADGSYSFSALPPSDASGYTVTETQPAGYSHSPVAVPTSGSGAPSAGGSYSAGSNGATPGDSSYSGVVIGDSTTATGYHFPELRRPTLSGLVYVDLDADSAYTSGSDQPIAGALVLLRRSDTLDEVARATTDASGAYAFSQLDPLLSYTLEEPLPAAPAGVGALANGAANPGTVGAAACASGCTAQADTPSAGTDRIASIDLSTGVDGAAFRFGELALAGISGLVHIDGNRDHSLGADETGRVGGVLLTLVEGSSCSAPALQTQTTGADGAFSFSALVVGRAYTVCASLPAGYGSGHAAGTPGATQIAVAALAPAGSSGLVIGVELASVSGLVYQDNGTTVAAEADNGQRDAGEVGIANVPLTLSGTDLNGNPVSQTTTSDSNGAWRFDGLLPPDASGYSVSQGVIPAAAGSFVDGRESVSASDSAGGSSSVNDRIAGIAPAAGQQAGGYLFGELGVAPISGTVYIDFNRNGSLDPAPADGRLAGVTLTLVPGSSCSGTPLASTITQADGAYSFTGAAAGLNYALCQTQPDGYSDGGTNPGTSAASSAANTITLTNLLPGGSAGNHFGEIAANASVAGTVWLDNNRNAIQDSGETGLAGVSVTLSGQDIGGAAISRSTSTDASGVWRIDGLPPSSAAGYTLTEGTPPADTVNGPTVAGSVGGSAVGSASAESVTPSTIAAVVLPLGGVGSGYNFGELSHAPDLRVSKTHSPSRLTVNNPVTYTLRVRNVGQLASSGRITVDDRLPAGLTLAATPSGNGWSCTGNAGDSAFRCVSSTALAAGSTSADSISASVQVGAAALAASPVRNAVRVEGEGEIAAYAPSDAERAAFDGDVSTLPACSSAEPDANACADAAEVQASAGVSGTAWLDSGSSRGVLDGGDTRLSGWTVQVIDAAGGVRSARTGTDGSWALADLVPGQVLTIRYLDPASGVVFGYPVNGESGDGSSGVGCVEASIAAAGGQASSCVQSGSARPELLVVLAPGAVLTQQSLPVDPSGVVYDASTRAPVPGAVVALAPSGSCAGWDPATMVVGATLGGYRISGSSVEMTVGAEGAYQFLLAPSAPASCTFGLLVTPPAGGAYVAPSSQIPPQSGPLSPPGAVGSVYAVQPQADAPSGSDSTTYYTQLVVGSGTAGVVNNHIPLDPALPSSLSLRKTADRRSAEPGDSVRYTLTVRVGAGSLPLQTTVVDRLPAGLTYIRGSARVNGVASADPQGGLGPVLAFHLGAMPSSGSYAGSLVLQYRVRVGVGAQQGDGINRARAHACAQAAGCVGSDGRTPLAYSVASNEGQHQLQISGGVFSELACMAGKVYVDCNHNHLQDAEEIGIPGVRLVLQDGTTLISDVEGKYSVCGLTPRSHVLRLDPTTLPRGSRLVTSSSRNLGDAGSLWLDLKNGELHRADFIEGSCSNTVLEQVKARRAHGEVRAPETERDRAPALRLDSKAHGLDTLSSPRQGTDSANQATPQPRRLAPAAAVADTPAAPAAAEQTLPTPDLPMNRPPPPARPTGTAAEGGSDAAR